MAAILSVVLPCTLPTSHTRFANSNKKKQEVLRGYGRKAGSHLTVRCVQNEEKLLTISDNDIDLGPIRLPTLTRNCFPIDFKFGGSTSAIQSEGALDEGGRGPSTIDPMFQNTEERKKSSGSYHCYKEDVKLLKNMGMDSYRFSISWSRILPSGKGRRNKDGIKFYKNLIDDLLRNGIEPVVTLFHFDPPQDLEDKYGAFASEQIRNDFKEYARVCFEEFGDQVKCWITMNEPQIYSFLLSGVEPNTAACPFVVTHNMLLAHADAAKLYRDEFKDRQGGEIGFSLVCQWFEPYNSKEQEHIDAAKRAWDFWVGWILEPLLCGDYPSTMRNSMCNALPVFTDTEKKLVRGSIDFLGFNYYSSRYAKNIETNSRSSFSDLYRYQRATWEVNNSDGNQIGPKAPGGNIVYIYPVGLTKALLQTSKYVKPNPPWGPNLNPKIMITENGYPEPRDDTLPLSKALEDDARIKYIFDHLFAIKDAMRKGANVKGYFVWSMMDVFEPSASENVRYGLNYVDFTNDLKRYPKKSAKRLQAFLQSSAVESRTSDMPVLLEPNSNGFKD